MLSDALKKGMSHQDQIAWTSDMNSWWHLMVLLLSPVQVWCGSAFLALVAQHGLMSICNMNPPDRKWKIAGWSLKEYSHQALTSWTWSDTFHQRLRLTSGLHIVSIGSLKVLRSYTANINSWEFLLMDAWLALIWFTELSMQHLAQEQQPQQRHCARSSNQTLRPELSKWPTPESFPKAKKEADCSTAAAAAPAADAAGLRGAGVRFERHDGPQQPFLAVDAHDCH